MANKLDSNKTKKTLKSLQLIYKDIFKKNKHTKIFVLSTFVIALALFISFVFKNLNVAKVNGEYISKLDYYNELNKQYGNTVLDDLITKKIIYQEAKKQNISVSDQEINDELDKIRKSVEDQGSTLEDVLQFQGVSYAQLIENIKIQKILEVILADNISVSDDEIQQRYDENKDIYGSDKTFDDLKEDIRFQIFQEKITNAYQEWINQKRSESVIQKYI